MAYRAFDEWQHAGAAAEPTRSPAADAVWLEPLFTPLERAVIEVARSDDPISLSRRRPLLRLAEALFGFRFFTDLANARLEALRRFAILARAKGDDLPQEEIDRFLAAGFSTRAALSLYPLSR